MAQIQPMLRPNLKFAFRRIQVQAILIEMKMNKKQFDESKHQQNADLTHPTSRIDVIAYGIISHFQYLRRIHITPDAVTALTC